MKVLGVKSLLFWLNLSLRAVGDPCRGRWRATEGPLHPEPKTTLFGSFRSPTTPEGPSRRARAPAPPRPTPRLVVGPVRRGEASTGPRRWSTVVCETLARRPSRAPAQPRPSPLGWAARRARVPAEEGGEGARRGGSGGPRAVSSWGGREPVGGVRRVLPD